MQRLRELWIAFRNFAIVFSFIMNFILLLVLINVVLLIFQIKNGIAEPLLQGLHSNFVGLDEARIQTEIQVNDEIPINFTLPVSDEIPINFTLPVSDNTDVYLTEDVVIDNVPAYFAIEGGAGNISGTVDIRLPAETRLPIRLSLSVPVEQTVPININVPVQQTIPVSLTVPVDIPLNETQLHEPFNNLRNLFEPYVRALGNLPSNWGDVPAFVGDVLSGNVNLMNPTNYTRDPWKGFEGEQTPESPAPDGTPVEGATVTPDGTTPSAPVEGGTPITETPPPPPIQQMTPTFTPFGATPVGG
ncbi:MAG: hypothetical protein HY862_04390 [Chloroflexi bacterium]|nr:hypothetical protein [Chloroflexota bacterium]